MNLRNIFLIATGSLAFGTLSNANPIATDVRRDLELKQFLEIRTPAPVFPIEKRQATGSQIYVTKTTPVTTITDGAISSWVISTRTETSTADPNGPTPSSKFKYHWSVKLNVDTTVTGPPSWEQYPWCKVQTNWYNSGNNVILKNPVDCSIKIVWPAPPATTVSRCKHTTYTSSKTYDATIGATVTPVYDCLVQKNTKKFTKSGKTVYRYQKGDFQISRWYDSRNYAWFEGCYNGPPINKRSVVPRLQKRDLYVGNGNCPIWNCDPTSADAFKADTSDFYPDWPNYFAWWGVYNSTSICSTVAITRACLLQDSVIFDLY